MEVDEITVIRAGALGDVVLTLPAVSLIRSCYPQAHIRAVGYPAYWEVAGSLVDEVLSIDAADVAGLFAGHPGVGLRDHLGRADLAVAWTHRDPTGALYTAGVRRVLHASPFPPPGTHAARWALDTLAPLWEDGDLSTAVDPDGWRLSLAPSELRAGREALDRLGVRRPVVLHPGAGAAWKRWPVERYAELAAKLHRRGHEVLLAEGPADGDVVAEVQRDMTVPLPTLPRMGARALAAVLAQAQLVVGNDSGVTHLASATGAPTIALFGPTDPASWRPLGRPRILRRCTKTAAGSSAIRVCDDPDCMAALSVEKVLEAVDGTDVQNRVETCR